MLVKFPHEETGRARKLSRPCHGPYRVVKVPDPTITAVKVYFPEDGEIHVAFIGTEAGRGDPDAHLAGRWKTIILLELSHRRVPIPTPNFKFKKRRLEDDTTCV